MILEQIFHLSVADNEERQENSPMTPALNKSGARSASTSPLNPRYSVEITPTNSPLRLRRRRDPTPFNVLVIGLHGSGKTSFIEFLRDQLDTVRDRHSLDADEVIKHEDQLNQEFVSYFADGEINGERIAVTLWDSRGFDIARDAKIVDLQMDEIRLFLESKFEETFLEETKVKRPHKNIDTHIHCVFYLIDPMSPYFQYDTSVDPLDILIIKRLSKYTTIIPIISKVDTCTKYRVENIKYVWRKEMEKNAMNFLEFLGDGENHDDDSKDISISNCSQEENYDEARNLLPFGCMSPDKMQKQSFHFKTKTVAEVCREYPWGKADPLNKKHCDFLLLKEMVFGEWRNEMREFCKEVLYENWRTDRLEKLGNISSKMTKFEN
ncbi:uncharacterized protein T551_01364 [Pneumocystis jirovecii RU7]|uniref:Septin-type G domain-containing protein n=1 Tax=Pneumocystis jirovecii (strain RU7) TaxID=1408657 RepID=A0A0W4ZSH6_PNEJ7|nr:uncharacterized protein T551_01364 [Pneumocystis jirovecii RU7]KTW31292.1 hypothetical protein T551_01364 [Pneumocystis jirovecii RU7]